MATWLIKGLGNRLYYGVLAMERASPEKRIAWSKTLREDLFDVMEPDSTWVNLDTVEAVTEKQRLAGFHDNTDPGRRIYSAAMALLALARLPDQSLKILIRSYG